MQQAKQNVKFLDILITCSRTVGYFNVQNNINPVKRLYVKNITEEDIENAKIRVTSSPAFLLTSESDYVVLGRKTMTKFELDIKISPVFMVAQNKRAEGEIIVEVLASDKVIQTEKTAVTLTPFNECDYSDNPDIIASFVRRTAEINKLMNAAYKKLDAWGISTAKGAGYQSSRNGVRNYFAAVFGVLCDQRFVKRETEDGCECITDHSELLISKIASPLELCLLSASLVEANGQNALIGRIDGKWYVGCFLTNECFNDTVSDDAGIIRKKVERGVNDISLICADDIFGATAFERAEKSAVQTLKKTDDVDFFIDLKRARIMHLFPLPERIKKKDGYDLAHSKDYVTSAAPSQLSEYEGDIKGETEVNRVTQWERRLLDMDMRNALLNFKVSQTAVKLLVPNLEDFIENIAAFKSYTVEPRPKDHGEILEKSTGFERTNYLKPFIDYILYEYKNKRLRTVFDDRAHDGTLTRLFRKEKSTQEETGTATLYVAAGFLKWCEGESSDEKYAPLFLYPAELSKKGAANPQYSLDVNAEEVRVNSTLLEFLYQNFNLDMRGLANVDINDPQDALSVLSRIKREIVGFKKWEVMSDVFVASLSFANYLLWSDVRYKSDRFRAHPVIRSLINNRLELDRGAFDLSDRSSDEAYGDKERMYLPISADSSQYSAIYDSLSKSFVLHGPPGTGKSQTITNIIANNIVRGRRVLFVAEKMAALSVVQKRINAIGLGDFCLELHSSKTDKNQILGKILHTLSLADDEKEELPSSDKAEEISILRSKLQGELDALHRKRYLGFSLYDAMLNYFDNKDAPDCLTIDSLFYERLTQTSFNTYLDVLTELALRAKECGDIDKSPFRHIGRFDYSESWRERADGVIDVYIMEAKHLRQYAKSLMPLFNIRAVSLTKSRLDAMYDISALLDDPYIINYFANCKKAANAKGLAESFREAYNKNELLIGDYEKKYGAYPADISLPELYEALRKDSYPRSVKRIMPSYLEKKERASFTEYLIKCEENRQLLAKRAGELSAMYGTDDSVSSINSAVKKTEKLYREAQKLYADLDVTVFNECCIRLTKGGRNVYLDFYKRVYDSAALSEQAFKETFCIDTDAVTDDLGASVEYAVNIQRNLDLIPSWCKYQEMVEKCRTSGFEFILEPLSLGEITADDILSCFKKCVYHNFIRSELCLDDVLCQFSGLTLEEAANKFKLLTEEYEKLTRQELYDKMVRSLPRSDTPGDHNLERVLLMRAEKTNMKGTTLRKLLSQIPNILKATCPCMLMSPTTVTQFLDIDMDKFDLVIFDEASQVPTCKAIGSIVRGNDLIVVGDPKQLPPTTFFSSDYKDDEHYEVEDLESILDDCLALGMPENHLLWHYRSNHESLIAFSNAMYYDNTLLTFPSPNELNSKVTFRYVDGIYERGGSKCNKKEADALIQEVIARLKDPSTRSQSIGIVTFNTAQQNYIENSLVKQIHQHNLETVAFECDEPVFVKNLESVQGDERDVIMFSIGYGPDSNGKLSLNFGPINQSGGYKRLNVAVTRARNEMKVFSAITGNMIDLSRTNSRGVAGLKAFLEYAERGKDMLAINSPDVVKPARGIGALIAEGLKDRGIPCEYDVGVSGFKIDVAVVDPRNKDRYILAILCDSENACKLKGVKDRVAMQTRILKKLGWNTYQMWTVNYFNNPRRELQKIKETVTALTEKKVLSKKALKDITNRYRGIYKSYYAKPLARAGAEYVLDFINEEKIQTRIRDIIETESPIEERVLLDKLLVMYNVPKTSKRAVALLTSYVQGYSGFAEEFGGKVFYKDKPVETFRPNDTKTTRDITRVHPYEIIAAARCAAETKMDITRDEAVKEIYSLFGLGKRSKAATEWIENAIDIALRENLLVLTVEGVLST